MSTVDKYNSNMNKQSCRDNSKQKTQRHIWFWKNENLLIYRHSKYESLSKVYLILKILNQITAHAITWFIWQSV